MKRLALFGFTYSRLAFPTWLEPHGAHFQARNLLVSPTQVAINAGASPVVLTLQHANPRARGEALDRLPGISNYYLGNDPKKWRTDVPHFARVRYHEVYPGIDIEYYGNVESKLEDDFIVRPGAEPNAIRIVYNQPVHPKSNGDLVVAGLRQR